MSAILEKFGRGHVLDQPPFDYAKCLICQENVGALEILNLPDTWRPQKRSIVFQDLLITALVIDILA